MAVNIYDLDAEGVAKIITDNAAPSPSLHITNNGTGFGLRAEGIAITSTASVDVVEVGSTINAVGSITTNGGVIARSTATTGTPLLVQHQTALSSATVAPLVVLSSTASGPAFEFRGRCIVSALSGASITGGIRVKWGDTYRFIPLMDSLGGIA